MDELRRHYLKQYFTAISSRVLKNKRKAGRELASSERQEAMARFKSLYQSISGLPGDEQESKLKQRMSKFYFHITGSPSLVSGDRPRTVGAGVVRVRRWTGDVLSDPGRFFRDYAEFIDVATDREHICIPDDAEGDADRDEDLPPTAGDLTADRPSSLAATADERLTALAGIVARSPPVLSSCRLCRAARASILAPLSLDPEVGMRADADADASSPPQPPQPPHNAVHALGTPGVRRRRPGSRVAAHRLELAALFAEPEHEFCAPLRMLRLDDGQGRSPSATLFGDWLSPQSSRGRDTPPPLTPLMLAYSAAATAPAAFEMPPVQG